MTDVMAVNTIVSYIILHQRLRLRLININYCSFPLILTITSQRPEQPSIMLGLSISLLLVSIAEFSNAFAPTILHTGIRKEHVSNLHMSTAYGLPTELPDSLDDSAIVAAQGCMQYVEDAGNMGRCRVDFDTSIGDETYTMLKSSTEFMQKFVTALSYEMIPGAKDMREKEMMALVQAKADLRQLMEEEGISEEDLEETEGDGDGDDSEPVAPNPKIQELQQIIQNGGRQMLGPSDTLWDGPVARVYFPDEGSAALARRDWNPTAANPEDAFVPPCVEFSSCEGFQQHDISKDQLIFFFCPRATEAEFVEEMLLNSEETLADRLKLTVFVNPILVDMGVTGFGMAGRMLRDRLIDPLMPTYYLRTLPWGALTRLYPRQFTVWQEDEESDDGYRMIKSMNRLPSNPEVEDIYDYENDLADDPEKNQGFGLLNAIGDFVTGMTRL
jgi:hypothetical protein